MPELWAGVGLVRGGAGKALVGVRVDGATRVECACWTTMPNGPRASELVHCGTSEQGVLDGEVGRCRPGAIQDKAQNCPPGVLPDSTSERGNGLSSQVDMDCI